jgi:acyl carrier protein
MKQPMSTNPQPTAEAISARIRDYVAEILQVKPEEVAIDRDVGALGLSSVSLVGLVGELEDWLNVEISPAVLYDHPSIEKVSAYLASEANLEQTAQ